MAPAVTKSASNASTLAATHATRRGGLYSLLMTQAAGLLNDDLFARMLVSQAGGHSALPAGLGLDSSDFRTMMTRHFPGFGLPAQLARAPDLGERGIEWDDLLALLMQYRAGNDPSETWLALIVATACMGGDHLWQDLGLWQRDDLTQLMARNFPGLTALNSQDMKWKKFLYKQLCNRAGVYACRAPSCEVCIDYAKCFGRE